MAKRLDFPHGGRSPRLEGERASAPGDRVRVVAWWVIGALLLASWGLGIYVLIGLV